MLFLRLYFEFHSVVGRDKFYFFLKFFDLLCAFFHISQKTSFHSDKKQSYGCAGPADLIKLGMPVCPKILTFLRLILPPFLMKLASVITRSSCGRFFKLAFSIQATSPV